MKDFEISAKVTQAGFDELGIDDRVIVEQAKEATFRSYAPYSRFCVGAAIRLDNGEVVVGSNQENAAYPSGLCAERTAAFYAHAKYPQAKFQAIAIAARDTDGQFCDAPISPCGACRQSLLEYETLAGHPVKVILVGKEKVYILESIKSLLPFAFVEFK
ncbi:MAG: cytidine deaminase [Clostridium sp.]|nr:cytidine deaminase [Clostridium sp.]